MPPPKYRHEPYGPPQPHRMGSVQTRHPTCWDPPGNRPLPIFQPYDPPQSRQPSCWEPPPHRASQGYSDYDLPAQCCWDPPRQRTDNCYPPPYLGPDMGPDSYVEPRNSYARYRPWQPQYHPRPATKAEDPINSKLDRLLEAFDRMETWVGATNRWVCKFRSSPLPEPDLDPPNVSAPLRKIAYPPSRNNEASFGPSGLVPNDSAAPPRHRTKSDQPHARQPSCWEAPLMAAPAVDQIHQPYQPPPPLPRSDRQSQQPSPAPPLELLPYSTPGPSQRLQPLPETAPLLASNRLPQAAVPSSKTKEWQTNLQNAGEYGLISNVASCLHDVVWEESIVEDNWKENGIEPKVLVGSNDGEDSDIFRMIILRAFDPGICVSFSKRKCGFLAMQMAKTDLSESEKELPLEGVIECLFVAAETFRIELHMLAKHVVFTNARKFNGDDEGRRSAVRCAFDPGGDASPKILL